MSEIGVEEGIYRALFCFQSMPSDMVSVKLSGRVSSSGWMEEEGTKHGESNPHAAMTSKHASHCLHSILLASDSSTRNLYKYLACLLTSSQPTQEKTQPLPLAIPADRGSSHTNQHHRTAHAHCILHSRS